MYTKHNTVKISDLRKHTQEVLAEIENTEQPIVIFSRSQPKVVIMSFNWFKKMQKNIPEPESNPEDETGLDFFANPPEEFLIKEKGLDAVKLIRAERD